MKENDKEKLSGFLDDIHKEANDSKGHYVKLSDVSDKVLTGTVDEKVTKVFEDSKLRNDCVDMNSMIYDLHGVLNENDKK